MPAQEDSGETGTELDNVELGDEAVEADASHKVFASTVAAAAFESAAFEAAASAAKAAGLSLAKAVPVNWTVAAVAAVLAVLAELAELAELAVLVIALLVVNGVFVGGACGVVRLPQTDLNSNVLAWNKYVRSSPVANFLSLSASRV